MTGYNAVLARNTEHAPKCAHAAQSVAFSHYNHLSAQLPVDPNAGNLVAGGIKEQAEQCFKNIKAIIEGIHHSMQDVVQMTIFMKDIKEIGIVDEVYKVFFPGYVPARTVVAVADLPMNALIQIEALLSNGEGTIPNAPQAGDLIKLTNNTANAPICPLSAQSVAFSHYNHLSAQLPIDPKSGRIVADTIKEQARQCFKNIKSILESMEVPFDDIVKINIFLKNLSDLDAVREVYKTFFPDSAIARAAAYVPALTVVAACALPMNALVEVEAVVSHGDGTPPQAIEDRHGIVVKANNTEHAPKSSFSTQTVAFSHYNHLSAQLPVNPQSGKFVAGGIEEQAEQCLKNIQAIVESVGHVMEDIVKVNIFLTHISDLDAVDEVYKRFFPGYVPARSVIGVSALPQEALLQIDAIVSNAEGTPPEA